MLRLPCLALWVRVVVQTRGRPIPLSVPAVPVARYVSIEDPRDRLARKPSACPIGHHLKPVSHLSIVFCLLTYRRSEPPSLPTACLPYYCLRNSPRDSVLAHLGRTESGSSWIIWASAPIRCVMSAPDRPDVPRGRARCWLRLSMQSSRSVLSGSLDTWGHATSSCPLCPSHCLVILSVWDRG
ncbi:hypothetical protein LX36DRAFT_192877 [Colletotrichum falcatum]|nr:hypothetical protein LX36DRAFT_192877 [Colletotrichum falcatum]